MYTAERTGQSTYSESRLVWMRSAPRFRLFALLSLLLFPSILPAQSGADTTENLGVAVIVGKTHAWMLEAPENWILDPKQAEASGLGAAFYPSGETWSKAEAVMYANTIPKSSDSVTVRAVIAEDVGRAENRIPKTTVNEEAPIGTIQGVNAQVRYFARSDSTLFEAVAYIDCPTAVALVVLSSRSAKDFRSSLPAFSRLVDSYEWITDNPAQSARIPR